LPTVLDLLGVQHGMLQGHGRSLVPAIDGATLPPQPAYAETRMPFTSYRWSPLQRITTDQWTYVRSTRPELYESGDLAESHDRSSELPEVVRAMEAQLAALESTLRRGRGAPVAVR